MSTYIEKRHGRKVWIAYALLFLVALGFRLFVALRLPNDTPGDGIIYAQMARNILEQHVYSHETQAPFIPSIIRLPGYPLFLAGVYALFGHANNTAVRVLQALLDTITASLIALLAYLWTTDQLLKHRAAIGAFVLASLCPFTTIYVATILTEVPTNLFIVLLALLVTMALRAQSSWRARVAWAIAGLVVGLAVLFRPDSGLLAAAAGITILLSAFATYRQGQTWKKRFVQSVISAAIFSVAFCLVLVPWTIRNRRVFGVFQPLAPMHAEMPGEFVPRGYLMWVRSWLDDGRYIGPALWNLDNKQIKIETIPATAFDSPEEKARVAELFAKYNKTENQAVADTSNSAPQTSPSPTSDEDESSDSEDSDDETDEPAEEPDDSDVEMTPEIDAGFAQIARERIARHPMRYYLALPAKRAIALWFDTHSQYWPFEGDLLPLKDLDYDIHQHWWLPLFVGLTWFFTILGVVGGWFMWRSRMFQARLLLVFASLVIFLRLGFLSTMENPEPRYTVEFFPLLAILGGIALAHLLRRRRSLEQTVES
ncbi:MAG TPA: glycosyltransferase family 39 protein [Pyrinomonadaceae bacterium]|nr:glycosyltransferase family 39 protein [Pyrinomonadaceae bacterium]